MTDSIATLAIPAAPTPAYKLKLVRVLRDTLGISGQEARSLYEEFAGDRFDARLTQEQLGALIAYNASVPPVQQVLISNVRARPTPLWVDLVLRQPLSSAIVAYRAARVGRVED